VTVLILSPLPIYLETIIVEEIQIVAGEVLVFSLLFSSLAGGEVVCSILRSDTDTYFFHE
jgi:hypothetical protein